MMPLAGPEKRSCDHTLVAECQLAESLGSPWTAEDIMQTATSTESYQSWRR